MSAVKFKVFVYGTLKQGEANHVLLASVLKAPKKVRLLNYQLFDTGCGFPAILPKASKRVEGELYEVDHETLMRMDLLEGAYRATGLYFRTTVRVYDEKGNGCDAYAYVWNRERENLQPLDTSNWTRNTPMKGVWNE